MKLATVLCGWWLQEVHGLSQMIEGIGSPGYEDQDIILLHRVRKRASQVGRTVSGMPRLEYDRRTPAEPKEKNGRKRDLLLELVQYNLW